MQWEQRLCYVIPTHKTKKNCHREPDTDGNQNICTEGTYTDTYLYRVGITDMNRGRRKAHKH